MWLLENAGDLFGGRKLWLRPGKRYLFGRTVSEPGQLAISDKTISRKHLTIQIDNVKPGEGLNRHSRTTVTMEDLNTKIGTLVNGVQIRGQAHVLTDEATNEIKMGHCSKLFRLTWNPVVLSFSFTAKELRADPWKDYRDDLEQLDIKYIAEYDLSLTTHVVAKKRNTSKGLQALVNGKYIVTDSFIKAVLDAATPPADADGAGQSPLENDYEGNWPNELEHLPPRGEEPSNRPVDAYAPNKERKEIFDGYTFIFYDKKQHENLFAPITNGKGKALLREVVPHETQIDDFIRYVKEVAGEKGLGEFEDGSEGKGVVVVKYAPAKGDTMDWYVNFVTSISLRLDHRLVDQREFLDAILANNAAMLRRPLEVERTQPEPSQMQPQGSEAMDVDQPQPDGEQQPAPDTSQEAESAPRPRRGRGRRPVTSRFKGFDIELDPDEETPSAPSAPSAPPSSSAVHANDMFMSQNGAVEDASEVHGTRQNGRKRPASPLPEQEEDVFEEMAPTAAAAKRRRIARGEDPLPPPPEPEGDEEEVVSDSPPPDKAQKGKKKGKENDILELAAKKREEMEKRAAEERQRLEELPDDGIDYEEIRRLTIVEPMEVRQKASAATARSREQDIADGRWDPAWNGRRNFKKFRKQGQPAGRPQQRVIVGLEEVRAKEYGIGDDYWLEDDSHPRKKAASASASASRQTQSQGASSQSQAKSQEAVAAKGRAPSRSIPVDDSDDSGENDAVQEIEPSPAPEPELPRTRAAKTATRANARLAQTQTQTQSQRSSKRAAAAPPDKEKAAKKPRKAIEVRDSDDDSDDELKFRFGRRR
ncbi:uncharacterized protein E0L32_004521 [Thyridium curvatum]|uniref:FHA domain-containing protein n=1 Tax=Thyridium curvatum TaxID=1093900 RepID=A0A507B9F4_9PEZI|nr:uncharacterized protein E0L32_004521 [Thyridium curvatum]TPX15244.1 hypothetical protein E0L32_004521 [Thyridium curvatum]